MKPIKLIVRVDSANTEHVRITLFAGEDTPALIGNLCMKVGEYQILGAALSLGAKATEGHLEVVHQDEFFRIFTERS